MNKTQIKRLLALLKAKAEYDRELHVEVPRGFKKSFEEQPDFRGWINYHVTWDVDKDDPWKVVARKISLAAEWQRELIKVVPVITPDGNIITGEEWEKENGSKS
jgi:hypothetical protein